MKDVVRLVRRHFDGIVAWTQTRQTNGFIDAINGLFQAAKRKARGYARFETMRAVLFLIAGKLDFSRFNENARCPVTHSVLKRAHKWLTDLTEFQIPAGKVYLSPVIDCFDGLVVSWSIGTRPDADLVNTMLDSAIESVAGCKERPIVHSDRGAHYRWPGCLSRMLAASLTRSMSRKGCSPENAACEGFFGRLKTELFYPRDWRATTIDQFIEIVDSYIRW